MCLEMEFGKLASGTEDGTQEWIHPRRNLEFGKIKSR